MASTTNVTHPGNTPQPYGGNELAGDPMKSAGHSGSGSQVDTPPTNGAGAAVDARSKPSLATGQTPSQNQNQNQNQSQGQNHQSRSGNIGGLKDTNGVSEPAEEEGGAARGTSTDAKEGEEALSNKDKGSSDYPEQRHAGRLDGVGPEYGANNRVTLGDRFQGMKEEIKGSIKKDPEMKKAGKERMTGDLKRKQAEKEQSADPFQNAKDDDEDKDKQKHDEEALSKKTRTEKTDEPGLTEQPHAHPTEKGRVEQAASIHPEGTSASEIQQ